MRGGSAEEHKRQGGGGRGGGRAGRGIVQVVDTLLLLLLLLLPLPLPLLDRYSRGEEGEGGFRFNSPFVPEIARN